MDNKTKKYIISNRTDGCVARPKYRNKRPYKKVYRGMDKNTRNILWTALWFAFLGGLCVLFNSAAPLWLLILWLIGMSW